MHKFKIEKYIVLAIRYKNPLLVEMGSSLTKFYLKI